MESKEIFLSVVYARVDACFVRKIRDLSRIYVHATQFISSVTNLPAALPNMLNSIKFNLNLVLVLTVSVMLPLQSGLLI